MLCPSLAVAQSAPRPGAQDRPTLVRVRAGDRVAGEVSVDGHEVLAGRTLVIGIDGGRLRPKRGRKKVGQKRQGYHSDWRAPKTVFTDCDRPRGAPAMADHAFYLRALLRAQLVVNSGRWENLMLAKHRRGNRGSKQVAKLP